MIRSDRIDQVVGGVQVGGIIDDIGTVIIVGQREREKEKKKGHSFWEGTCLYRDRTGCFFSLLVCTPKRNE